MKALLFGSIGGVVDSSTSRLDACDRAFEGTAVLGAAAEAS